MSRAFTPNFAAAMMLVACAVEDGERESGTAGITSAGTPTSGADGSGGGEGPGEAEGEGEGEGPGADDGPHFDVGAAETSSGSGGMDEGCQKVDFLFVIDNSASMEDEQDALIEAFPGFMM